jgi:uncharacterized membrane protein
MPRIIPAFARDQGGNIAITAGLFFAVVLGIAGLAVDLGTVYTDRRKAQSAADLAAIAAATDLANADKAAAGTIARNKVAASAYTLQIGVYTPDPAIPPAQRFVPVSGPGANAVSVTLHTTSPLFFAKPILGKSSLSITTRATAARTALASFAIGSRLLKIDRGLLNEILGSLLGSSLSLSAMDYQALIDAQLDLFDFSKALASRLQVTGGTYDSVLNANANIGDIVSAMIDTEKNRYGPAHPAVAALAAIGQSVHRATNRLKLRSIIDLGPYNSMPVGQKPQTSVSASVFDVLTATAQIANGQHQIQAALNVNLPGIAGASLQIAIGERPQHSSWFAVGAEGATVYTAQTRIMLSADLNGIAPVASVRVPVYLAIASGQAKLRSLQCGYPNIGASNVTLEVTPGIVDAWIGDVSGHQFANFNRPLNPKAATLANVLGITVTGRAHTTISNMTPTPVAFTHADIQQQVKKTVGTQHYTSSLTASLIQNTQLNVSGLGVPAGTVTTTVRNILANATSSIDQLLYSVLSTLGIGLGQADVWVTGLRCDGAALVQ